MLTTLTTVVGILLTIFIIVGLHEFGHFIVAKWSGIKVLRFSLGFGKPLMTCRDKSGTEYTLALIPLGGYVKMLDETFNHQPFFKKAAVIAAGPLNNFILAFLIYWFLFSVGFDSIIPVTGKILPHSIASSAGIKSHEEIIAVNDAPQTKWIGIIIALMDHYGNDRVLTIRTLDQQHHVHTYALNTQHWQLNKLKPDPLLSLGIVPEYQHPEKIIRHNHYALLAATIPAWEDVCLFTRINFSLLGKLITGKISYQSLGGPLSIFQSAGNALNSGWFAFMSFLAFISISIGVINVLPVPGLDGGLFLILILEKIHGKALSDQTQTVMIRLGMIVILLVMMQALMNDLMRLG